MITVFLEPETEAQACGLCTVTSRVCRRAGPSQEEEEAGRWRPGSRGGVSEMGAPTPEAGVVPADGPDAPGTSPLSGLGRASLHGPESL